VDEPSLRQPYKRTPQGVVVSLRRAYKRGRPPGEAEMRMALPEPKSTRPKWFLAVLFSGEVRCPRKWSMLAIEACAQIQDDSGPLCSDARCVCLGKADLFRAEIAQARKPSTTVKLRAQSEPT
jgi:hypothetical protein